MPFSPLLGSPKPQFFDNNGAPLVGGNVAFFAAGTSTPLDTYTTVVGDVANANPIVLDSRGEPPEQINGVDLIAYKAVLQDAAGAVLWTIDFILSTNSGGTAGSLGFLNKTISTIVNYNMIAGDDGALVSVTGNAVQIGLMDSGVAGNGYVATVINNGDNIVTVIGGEFDLINGLATQYLQPGEHLIVTSNGSSWNGPQTYNGLPLAIALGSVNAMTADFTPNIVPTIFSGGVVIQVKPVGQITTFIPTLSVNGSVPEFIVKEDDKPLSLTDIVASSQTMLLQYDSVLSKWIYLNPLNRPLGFGGALVYRTADISIVNGVPTILDFDFTDYDTENGTIHDDVTNSSRLTVPSGASWVRLTAYSEWGPPTVAGSYNFAAKILKMGLSNVAGLPRTSLSGADSDNPGLPTVSAVIPVAPGDYFELEVTNFFNNALALKGGISGTWFSMEILR